MDSFNIIMDAGYYMSVIRESTKIKEVSDAMQNLHETISPLIEQGYSVSDIITDALRNYNSLTSPP